MTDKIIFQISEEYRKAIELACANHRFGDDLGFSTFPKGSCGDSCSMLAEHLLKHYGLHTLWISNERDEDSHAWLVVKDSRIKNPVGQVFEAPEVIRDVLKQYSGGNYNEKEGYIHYEKKDVSEGLIIDITADQFDDFNDPVYVGYETQFHSSFSFVSATEHDGLSDGRLITFYAIVEEYLQSCEY